MMLNNAEGLPAILEEWEKRGQLLRASRGVEFVLSMRRATLDLAVQLQRKTQNTENLMLKQEIGKIWLKSAKIARKYVRHIIPLYFSILLVISMLNELFY